MVVVVVPEMCCYLLTAYKKPMRAHIVQHVYPEKWIKFYAIAVLFEIHSVFIGLGLSFSHPQRVGRTARTFIFILFGLLCTKLRSNEHIFWFD